MKLCEKCEGLISFEGGSVMWRGPICECNPKEETPEHRLAVGEMYNDLNKSMRKAHSDFHRKYLFDLVVKGAGAVDKWIRCSDKFPDNEKNCLIIFKPADMGAEGHAYHSIAFFNQKKRVWMEEKRAFDEQNQRGVSQLFVYDNWNPVIYWKPLTWPEF